MSYVTFPPQRCYYLSMEYYMGRSLTNAMVNLGIDNSVEEAIYEVNWAMLWGAWPETLPQLWTTVNCSSRM